MVCHLHDDPNVYEIDYTIVLNGQTFPRSLDGEWSRVQAAQMMMRLFMPEWGAVSVTITRTDRLLDTRSIAEIEDQVIA